MLRYIIAVISIACLPFMAQAGETFSIATGSPSGLYYPFDGGLASIWSKNSDKINMKAEVTGGSVVNIIQVSNKESEAGISQGDALRDAISGSGKFPEALPVRALFALYPNVVHAVTLKGNDIASLDDLRGKRVSIGAPGSGTAITTMNILNTLGITEEAFDVQYLSYTETSDGLKNGTIDAGFMVGGVGLAAMVELALTRDIVLIPFTDAEIARVNDAYPAYTAFDVPEKTYEGVGEPVQTATLWNFLVVHKDLPDAIATEMLEVAFTHHEALMGVTKVARFMTRENSLKYAKGILHPASEVFFSKPMPLPTLYSEEPVVESFAAPDDGEMEETEDAQ